MVAGLIHSFTVLRKIVPRKKPFLFINQRRQLLGIRADPKYYPVVVKVGRIWESQRAVGIQFVDFLDEGQQSPVVVIPVFENLQKLEILSTCRGRTIVTKYAMAVETVFR